MNCIATSLFDIFKIGPGPSSSHTIGPMRAGADFLKRLASLPAGQLSAAHHIEVELFGSLALTGQGHGTDRAVAAGLLGDRVIGKEITGDDQGRTVFGTEEVIISPGHAAAE